MSIKSVLSVAIAVLCFAPASADAGLLGHRAMGCGCADDCGYVAPSCGCEIAPSCGCEVSCDPCARGGRLKGLFSKMGCRHASPCCETNCCAPAPAPAPVCCEPAPCCDPCDPCDPCSKPKCSLFSKLKARKAARAACCPAPSCGCEAAPACGGEVAATPACGCN